MGCRSIFTEAIFQFVHVAINLSCLLPSFSFLIFLNAAVTFKDDYSIMTSLVPSHRWIFIKLRAFFIVSVTDEISLVNF